MGIMKQYEGTQTAEARALTEDNLALVPFFMNRMHLFGEWDDLEQAGRIGLMRAADKYEPELGKFSTYASAWIKNAIRRESDKQKSPGSSHMDFLNERLRQVTVRMLEGKLMRSPTHDEIMEVVGLKVANAVLPKNVSIDFSPLERTTYEGEWMSVDDTEPAMYDDLQQLDYLEPEEKALLIAHGMGYSHTEIAVEQGVLPSTIGTRLKKLKARLQDEL